jgi:hypothetical protein
MLVGYARVLTQEQDLALQLDALHGAGCERVFEEKASGAQRDRPALKAAFDYMREGDTLVVWKLDRLARSLKQLIETVEAFAGRGIGLRSLTKAIDTTKVVLAAAHLDHDLGHCGPRHRNVKALCQRCHLQHDRPEHRRRIRLTLRRRRALGDLFSGPYPAF